ncbi:ribonuclease H-like domain-containing protein [Lentinula edodes]|nr:ribonuclease H-like domain-containing protein [Lentinula edodes]
MKVIFGWKTRTTGDGIITISERGKNGIGAVADLLENYLKKHRDSAGQPNAVLVKWVEDISKGCEKAIKSYGGELPDIPITSTKRRAEAKDSDSEASPIEKRRKLSSKFASLEILQSKKRSRNNDNNKPDSSEIINRLSIKYIDRNTSKSFFGCIAERCDWLQAQNASSTRILKHATAECKYLSSSDKEFASRCSAGEALGAKVVEVPKSAQSSLSKSGKNTASMTLDFTEVGKADWRKQLDFCIMKLICVCGLTPNMIDTDEWKEFHLVATKGKLSATPSDTFENKYIPQEGARIHLETIKLLKKETNLTLTIDGGDTRAQDSVYTAHFTTPDRSTYFLRCYEGTDEHHTGLWVKDFAVESIDEIGRGHVSGMCCDSTGNTFKGRTETNKEVPTVMGLGDACHHLHNTTKDITNLEEFKPVISVLRSTIKHFSHSNYGARELRKACADNGITEGLVKIGRTRFATHYSAAVSLDRCFPQIQSLLVDKVIQPKKKDFAKIFIGQRSSMEFRLALVQYIKIIDPLARALWSLEAAQTNAADVYLFWLAIAAELKELFSLGESVTGIDDALAGKVIRIFNARYKAFIDNTPYDPYFTSFYLDPRFVNSDVLKVSGTIPAGGPTITISLPVTDDVPEANEAPFPAAYRRAKKALKSILRAEVEMYRSIGDGASIFLLIQQAGGSVQTVVQEFSPQLLAYSRKEYPFGDLMGSKSTLEWWRELLPHPKARVIAFLAVKMYSVLANSMPDERWGSKKTCLNTPLRNKQKVGTLANMIRIGDWYGTHMKPKKIQARPQVSFRDMSHLTSTSSNSSDESVDLCDAIDSDSEDDDVINEGSSQFFPNSFDLEELVLENEANLSATLLKQVIPKRKGDPSPLFVALAEPEVRPAAQPAVSSELGTENIDWEAI